MNAVKVLFHRLFRCSAVNFGKRNHTIQTVHGPIVGVACTCGLFRSYTTMPAMDIVSGDLMYVDKRILNKEK